jgi:hypothetical protein
MISRLFLPSLGDYGEGDPDLNPKFDFALVAGFSGIASARSFLVGSAAHPTKTFWINNKILDRF